jgi:acylphosphatase
MKRVHLLAAGRVQGVFYRASTEAEARRLGLAGWVRNLPDGRVEAIAEGPEAALEALVAWARKGPPAARVDDLAVTWEEPTGEFAGFGVRA